MKLLNAKVALSHVLLKPSLHFLCHNRLPLKHAYVYCDCAIMCVGTSAIRLRSIKSSLPSVCLYVTHVTKYSRPSPAFPYCK